MGAESRRTELRGTMRTGLLPAALLVFGVAVPARATPLVIPGAAQLRPVVAHPEREPRVFPRRAAELSLHGAGARVAHCDEPCGGVRVLWCRNLVRSNVRLPRTVKFFT